MKKLLALLMAVCLMVTMLAACGGNTDNSSSEGSSSGTSSPAGDTAATVADIADFEGTWKIEEGDVHTVKIDSAASSVTAYDADGFVIATFPAVATADGVVLKMGAFGEVTLKDPTALTITTVSAPASAPDLTGNWTYIWGDLPDDTVLVVKDGGKFDITGTKSDTGDYSAKDNDTFSFSPTKELGGAVTHEVLGGGDILNATSPSVRYYVRESALSTDTGKALSNYYTLFANKWSDSDAAMNVEFKDNGKIAISGADMGIWYPTATGATVEYDDGSKDEIVITDGSFTLNYYSKTFSAE